MTPEQALQTLKEPESWPYRVLLPLTHATRVDEYDFPLCGVLAAGYGARVFLANLIEFNRADLQSPPAFDAALKRFEWLSYVSLAAMLKDGWRVD